MLKDTIQGVHPRTKQELLILLFNLQNVHLSGNDQLKSHMALPLEDSWTAQI